MTVEQRVRHMLGDMMIQNQALIARIEELEAELKSLKPEETKAD
jgi:BMFP domain-containing protein YqiC